MSNRRHIDKCQKSPPPNCASNSIELKNVYYYCWKCLVDPEIKGRNKKYVTIRKLFHHLTICHSGNDILQEPSRDKCIVMLQMLSDAMFYGVLKGVLRI